MKTILKVIFFLFNTFLFQIAFYEVLVARSPEFPSPLKISHLYIYEIHIVN